MTVEKIVEGLELAYYEAINRKALELPSASLKALTEKDKALADIIKNAYNNSGEDWGTFAKLVLGAARMISDFEEENERQNMISMLQKHEEFTEKKGGIIIYGNHAIVQDITSIREALAAVEAEVQQSSERELETLIAAFEYKNAERLDKKKYEKTIAKVNQLDEKNSKTVQQILQNLWGISENNRDTFSNLVAVAQKMLENREMQADLLLVLANPDGLTGSRKTMLLQWARPHEQIKNEETSESEEVNVTKSPSPEEDVDIEKLKQRVFLNDKLDKRYAELYPLSDDETKEKRPGWITRCITALKRYLKWTKQEGVNPADAAEKVESLTNNVTIAECSKKMASPNSIKASCLPFSFPFSRERKDTKKGRKLSNGQK